MKKISSFLIVMLALIMASCGNNGVTPKSKTIEGALGEYFEITEKEYAPQNGNITIELKRTKDGMPEGWTAETHLGAGLGFYSIVLAAEMIDEQGNVLATETLKTPENSNIFEVMIASKTGETVQCSFPSRDGVAKINVKSTIQNKYSKDWFTVEGRKDAKPSTYADDFGWLSLNDISRGDVEGLSKDEINILANALRAHYGHVFNDPMLREYFGTFEWYAASGGDANASMNATEKHNLQTLQSLK